jgi:hypothetical protein
MWSDAASELAGYPDAVLTALDPTGYPVSVRQRAPRYDPATGQCTVCWPSELPVAAGPAVLLCHRHDENLWNIRQMHIKGRLERRADQWIFTSTDFRRPPHSQLGVFWRLARDMRRAGRRYLDRRGLKTPTVNWNALEAVATTRQQNSGSRLL